MINIFAPFLGNKPVPLEINGHRLLILSIDKNAIEDELDVLGADKVKRLRDIFTTADQERVFSSLAKSIDGGVVLAPENIKIEDLIRSLESELPWIQ